MLTCFRARGRPQSQNERSKFGNLGRQHLDRFFRQAAGQQNKVLVRFINGLPGGSASVSLGGQPAFSNVDYLTATPYQEFPVDRKGFALFTGTAAGNAPPVASKDKNLDAGGHYTVLAALNESGKEKLEVTGDDLTEPKNEKPSLA